MPFGPVQEGLAARMGGGAPPGMPQGPAGPPPGPGGQMMAGPPPGMGGGDPLQQLAEVLGEARMLVGELGPQRFMEVKPLLKGFIGSITQLQETFAGGGAPPPGPPGMPPGPGVPPQGPPPGPPGFPQAGPPPGFPGGP